MGKMRNIERKPVIGILGGMGPQASARLLRILVDKAANDFHVKEDSDFPEIILDSVPVPNFISNTKNAEKALKILRARVKAIDAFDASCFAVACNTAHIFLEKLQSSTKTPFISMVQSVIDEVRENRIKRVGLLATPVTIRSRFFQKLLEKAGIETVIPSKTQLRKLEKIIRKVIADKTSLFDTDSLLKIANSLKIRGAQGIILGCTELPLIFPKNFPLPTFDSLEILAQALLTKSFNKETN